jgi:multicomponent Na+:H+ antiporter subunit B
VQVFLDIVLFGFLIVLATAIVRQQDLFAAAMLTGIFSLLSAGLFTLLDAVDVAFTEAAVGAGIATVLVLGTLSLTDQTEIRPRRPLLPLLIVLITGAALFYGTLDMPRFGDPDAPLHKHVAPAYLAESAERIGIPNVVTSVLASYRGYDTLGELVVILAAGIGVLLLLGPPLQRPSRRDR